MVAFAAGRLLLEDFEREMNRLLAPFSRWTASVTTWLLESSGTDVARDGIILAHPGGFSYRVTYLCTGLVIVAFFVAGLATLPSVKRDRLTSAAAGSALILALNQLRLTSLFWVGIGNPAWFDFVHAVVWEATMLASVLALWWASSRIGPREAEGAGGRR